MVGAAPSRVDSHTHLRSGQLFLQDELGMSVAERAPVALILSITLPRPEYKLRGWVYPAQH